MSRVADEPTPSRSPSPSPFGTAAWEVLTGSGDVVVEGCTIGGWTEDRLFPWSDTIDVSRLEPGRYILLAFNDDPTGDTVTLGNDVDTKTIVVQ